MRFMRIWFLTALLFGAQTAGVQAQAKGPLRAQQLAAAYRTLNLTAAPNGQVMNACEEAVTPAVHAAELGGAVGRAYLIVVGGGPNTLTCYGMTGMAIYTCSSRRAPASA